MRVARCFAALLVLTAVLTTHPAPSSAQGIGGALKKKAEEAKKKLEEEAAKKAVADSAKKKAEEASKAPAAAPAAAPTAAPATASPNAAPSAPAKADPKVWDNYDFVPGNKVLFYTDFSEDKVGNFARGLKYKSGPAEVVERDGVKVLRVTGKSDFLIPIGRKLPERFTLEIDILPPQPKDGEHDVHQMLMFEGGSEANRGAKSAGVTWMPSIAWIAGGGQSSPASNVNVPEAIRPALRGKVAHVRVLMDSGYFKMYVNERRL